MVSGDKHKKNMYEFLQFKNQFAIICKQVAKYWLMLMAAKS